MLNNNQQLPLDNIKLSINTNDLEYLLNNDKALEETLEILFNNSYVELINH